MIMKLFRFLFNTLKCCKISAARIAIDIGIVIACYFGILFSYYRMYRIKPQDSWNVLNKVYMPPGPIPFDQKYNHTEDAEEITLVTAFFDLGTLEKRDSSNRLKFHSQYNYKEWMNDLAKLNNHIVLYIDDYETGIHFATLRGIHEISTRKTHVVNVRRPGFWAFQIAPRIKEIFLQKDFPKYYPHTVNEQYCAVKHLKYELILRAMQRCKTKYIGWIDVGYFKEGQKNIKPMSVIPKTFRSDHIAFQQIGEFNPTLQPTDVIYENKVWVSGSLFFGRKDYISMFIVDYQRVVNTLISRYGLVSSDEQVIYIMFLKHANLKPRVPIQTYYHACKCDRYYFGDLLMGKIKEVRKH